MIGPDAALEEALGEEAVLVWVDETARELLDLSGGDADKAVNLAAFLHARVVLELDLHRHGGAG